MTSTTSTSGGRRLASLGRRGLGPRCYRRKGGSPSGVAGRLSRRFSVWLGDADPFDVRLSLGPVLASVAL